MVNKQTNLSYFQAIWHERAKVISQNIQLLKSYCVQFCAYKVQYHSANKALCSRIWQPSSAYLQVELEVHQLSESVFTLGTLQFLRPCANGQLLVTQHMGSKGSGCCVTTVTHRALVGLAIVMGLQVNLKMITSTKEKRKEITFNRLEDCIQTMLIKSTTTDPTKL